MLECVCTVKMLVLSSQPMLVCVCTVKMLLLSGQQMLAGLADAWDLLGTDCQPTPNKHRC